MMLNQATSIGVVIGKFQTTDLHKGHIALIEHALSKHKDVIVFIGSSKVKLSKVFTMDFLTRKLMFEEKFGDRITILEAVDVPRRDDLWTVQIDSKIEALFPNAHATLYGSRDSFLPSYSGKFQIEYFTEVVDSPSGTELRNEAAKQPLPSRDFRIGVIYNAFNKYPIVYSTVDIAIFNDDETRILLGRKPTDPIGLFRFVGGFVDIADDNELQTVRREGFEETSAEIEPYEFVTSMMVRNDPRYKKETDQSIMTHLYKARYVSGVIKAADDLAEVKWFNVSDVTPEMLVGEHQPLFLQLKNNLEKKKQYDLSSSTLLAS